MSDVSNSGNVLKSINGTGLRHSLARLNATQPRVFIGTVPKARPVFPTGLSHYAAKPLAKSTAIGRKGEVQSKGISQPSYSRSDAWGIEASDRRINQARQADNRCNRRSYIPAQEGSRRLPARHGRTTEGSNEEIPPAKIKLGHYPRSRSSSPMWNRPAPSSTT